MITNIDQLLNEIKEIYQFQTDDELATLLEGLANPENKGVTYWDYIEVDTLLSLQKPKTNYPDEIIFITYHQIHELYFKLIIQELLKITHPERIDPNFVKRGGSSVKNKLKFIESSEVERWNNALKRCRRYMNKLIESFDVLKFGINDDFQEFRKLLLPASGFQTYQFRLIEIMITSFDNLIDVDKRPFISDEVNPEDDFEFYFENYFDAIYWRRGSIQNGTGEKTKLLQNFNVKYDELFVAELEKYSKANVYSKYKNNTNDFQEGVKNAMQLFEKSILIWKIAHFITIAGHIRKSKKGTGGTDWPKYLPVSKQRIFYFPSFWNPEVLNDEKTCTDELVKIVAEYEQVVKDEFKQIFKTSRQQEKIASDD